ncbi:LysE/ArgO family amino acid transporter [Legionella impletisoli]|uniref:Amino acid transporter LysE n=1 Tax=Legionella impletisoli TaxID=343510 RepID=A0A917NBN8_9GAMM|nr:LysE family transporter [Legionella impletisoli]GGI85031.1 amino acid transporter LysE [Legionella impletisoli]
MPIFLSGLALGLSLIMALGPQNIFLIRQGALRTHAVLSAITCFFCDVVLVTFSVVGLHHVLEHHPGVQIWMSWLGGLFLLFYGGRSLISAIKPGASKLKLSPQPLSRTKIIFLALGFSLLNPHAIIDSLVLIGGGSSQYPDHPNLFLMGVIASSLVWFTTLTCLAYFFSERLTQAKIWRRVEGVSGVIMIYLAFKLTLL